MNNAIAKLNKFDEKLFNFKCKFKESRKNSQVQISIEAWDFRHQRIVDEHLDFRRAIIEIAVARRISRCVMRRRVFQNEILWWACPKELGKQIYNAVVGELNRVLPLITAEIEALDASIATARRNRENRLR